MRALHFAKPLEFRVESTNDHPVQGDRFEGTLVVVNRDSTAHNGLRVEVGLAYAGYKALKESGAEALELLERQALAEKVALKPGAEQRYEWSFHLSPAFPVQTKEGGPFLLYGSDLDDPAGRGQIDLPVALSPALEAFIGSLENHFAFQERSRKQAEGFTEVRFKPPASYSTLEDLTLRLRLGDEAAELDFQGRMKALKRGEGGGVKNRKVGETRTIPRERFLMPGGQPNRGLYRQVLDEVLNSFLPAFKQKPSS